MLVLLDLVRRVSAGCGQYVLVSLEREQVGGQRLELLGAERHEL